MKTLFLAILMRNKLPYDIGKVIVSYCPINKSKWIIKNKHWVQIS